MGKDSYLQESRMRMRMKPSSLMSMLLAEAYHRNQDNVNWFDVFKKLQDAEKGVISYEDYYTYLDEKKIDIETVSELNMIGGYFVPDTRKVVIQISQNLYNKIFGADDEWLRSLAKNFWTNFVHEDTHRQQQNSAGDYDIRTDYKPLTLNDWNDDFSKGIEYFSQHSEAAAYGREVGSRLESIYGENNAAEIFLDLNTNSIEDEYSSKIISTYKDPRVSKKASDKFFKALYDFLSGNEL